ncbi:MAG TPA: MFS transporter [Novosphingobium sp.]|nr:MFS transporter [Novosphingobium sp.]
MDSAVDTGIAPSRGALDARGVAGFWASNRALITITLVNFVSLAGFGLMFPVFATYGRQIGASGMEIAGTVAVFSFGQFLSSPAWGWLSDRHGRRPVLIWGLVGGAAIYVLHVWAVTPLLLVLVRFISGMASGCFSVGFAVASDISTPATRTRVMGVVGAGFSLGFIFGPAIGGVTASISGQEHAFALVSVVGAVMGLLAGLTCWAFLPETTTRAEMESTSAPGTLALLRRPGFAAPVALALLSAAGFAKMEAVLGLFADDVLGLRPLGIGVMFGFMGLVTTATQLLLTGRVARIMGERRMLLASLAVIGVGMIVLGCAKGLVVAGLGLVFTSAGFALLNPALSGLTSLASPHDAQGAGLGLMQAASALGRVAGPAAAGVLYDAQGPAAPMFWAGAIFLAALAVAPFLPMPGAATTAGEGDDGAPSRSTDG